MNEDYIQGDSRGSHWRRSTKDSKVSKGYLICHSIHENKSFSIKIQFLKLDYNHLFISCKLFNFFEDLYINYGTLKNVCVGQLKVWIVEFFCYLDILHWNYSPKNIHSHIDHRFSEKMAIGAFWLVGLTQNAVREVMFWETVWEKF